MERLAQVFGVTAQQILEENKHINVNNLQKNDLISITICRNPNQTRSAQIELGEQSAKMASLCSELNKRFDEMLFWTHDFIASSLENTDNVTYIQNRIALIPKDITDILRPYYGEEEVEKLENLLREHFVTLYRLVSALKRNSPVEYNRYNDALYKNADEIVTAIVNLNPFYNSEELQKMMYNYIDILKKIITSRRNETYVQEIQNIDLAREQILQISNYIAVGLREKFPDRL